MPGYKATVVGENFEFVVDDEPQYLEFSRTLYVDAQDESAAQKAALAQVREELLAQSLLDDDADQLISVDDIRQADVLDNMPLAGDFIWTFPEEELYDDME